MRKNNNTRSVSARRQPPDFAEPVRRWSNFPITPDRARELVDVFVRYDDGDLWDALIQLICGLMPAPLCEDVRDLDERRLAGRAALAHAFARTHRAGNELGAYVVNLKCAEWE